jgi:hypothetical protein
MIELYKDEFYNGRQSDLFPAHNFIGYNSDIPAQTVIVLDIQLRTIFTFLSDHLVLFLFSNLNVLKIEFLFTNRDSFHHYNALCC